MSNQAILGKAIQKAIANGWSPIQGIPSDLLTMELSENCTRVTIFFKRVTALEQWSTFGLIFNRGFAEALWGEEDDDCHCIVCGTQFKHESFCPYQRNGNTIWLDNWSFHLRQMVISDDPIKYLGENIG